jgi:heat shock protein HslJ
VIAGVGCTGDQAPGALSSGVVDTSDPPGPDVSSPRDAWEAPSPLDASYPLDGQGSPVTLVNGRSEVQAAPGSAATVLTTVWEEPTVADLSGDGQDDAALVLVQQSGGSGTFYYLVVAIREGDGYRGIGGALLGDRILPQQISVEDDRVIVDYLARADDEAMATPPTDPRQRIFIYNRAEGHLARVAEDFEGDADPARMTLQMNTWIWQHTAYNNDTVEVPDKVGAFTLTFTDEGRILITTDCNNMQGDYEVEGNRLRFSTLAGTRMYCEGAQESLFAGMLEEVNGFLFTSRGELVLELLNDTGSMIFR